MTTAHRKRTLWSYLFAIAVICLLELFLSSAGAAAKPGAVQESKGAPPASRPVDPLCPPSWNARSPYPIPIMDNAVAAQGNFLYSFGGRTTSSNQTSSDYRYDPLVDAWTQIASLPESRQAASAVSDGTYIYVINGWRAGAVPTNTVYRYDPVANVYSRKLKPRPFMGRG